MLSKVFGNETTMDPGVVDKTEHEPEIPKVEGPTEEELISAVDPVSVAVAGLVWAIGYAIFKEVKEWLRGEKQIVQEVHCDCRGTVDVSNVSLDKPEPVLPDKPEPVLPDKPEPVLPDKPEPVLPDKPAPSTLVCGPDAPLEESSKDIAPAVSTILDSDNEKYDSIMKNYKTSEFADAESAAEYLAGKLHEAGIEVETTEKGIEVKPVLPDPAKVASQLHSRGIKDRELIERAVHEANSALAEIETTVKNLQASGSMPPAGPVMDRTTSIGVIIRASIETETREVADSGLASGFYPEPFRSVFVNAPNAWELIA